MNNPLILYIIGAAAMGLVVFSIIRLIRLRQCRRITGRVVDEVYEDHTDSDGHYTRNRYPIYEYEWQGEKHRYRSSGSGGKAIGSEVELYIDADGVIYEQRSAIFLLLFGLGFLLIVAVNLLH